MGNLLLRRSRFRVLCGLAVRQCHLGSICPLGGSKSRVLDIKVWSMQAHDGGRLPVFAHRRT